MTVTRHAKTLAQQLADQARSAQKAEYRRKLLRLQTRFVPPLTPSELADGLGIERRELGRFLSESERLRRARPDGLTRALIDALWQGDLFLAVQSAVAGGHREVLVCERRDVKRLALGFEVVNLAGGEVPERQSSDAANWDDGGLWDLFGSPTAPPDVTPRPPSTAVSADASPWTPARLPAGRPLVGRDQFPIGLGLMRLSTVDADQRLDASAAVALIHRALDAGVTLFDTADSYALDSAEMGHNERLLARALKSWSGDRDGITVADKCGLTRPGGKWRPDGRPEHLRAACEASLKHLEVETLDLLQLHVVDPKVPLADSVGELARLREEGKVRHVGLCNVQEAQIREAQALVPVASVQNGVSYFDKAALEKGLVGFCAEQGIPVIAHSPVGGHAGVGRAARNKAITAVAKDLGVEPGQVALSWLLHTAPGLIPIPGATRSQSLDWNLQAVELRLSAEHLARLDAGKRRSWALDLRRRLWAPSDDGPVSEARLGAGDRSSQVRSSGGRSSGEVVLFVGPPAGGKTSRVQPFLDDGYRRLNRDQLGGRLRDLVIKMASAIGQGERRFVLDNTYPTRRSRGEILDLARRHGLPVRCVWIDTSTEEALFNACCRMLDRQGKILAPAEVVRLSKDDPNMLPPAAIFYYFQRFEEPTVEEGFVAVERVTFERRLPADYTGRALLLDYDGTLRRSTGPAPFPLKPEEVEILPGRKEVLDRYVAAGLQLLGVSNQSAVGKGQLSREQVEACFKRTNELLGHDIPVLYSPHAADRAGVWDRKPMPGMGVQWIRERRLDRSRCLMVGDLESDELFARNCGIPYRDQAELFAAVRGPALV